MNSFLTIILSIAFSLSGIIFGMILSLISPEEMLPGKRYFILLRRTLFAAISLSIVLSLFGNIFLSLFFLIIFTILFLSESRFNNKSFYVIHYILFIIPYFLISEQNRSILASLIFLYGFPAGTLLRIKNER